MSGATARSARAIKVTDPRLVDTDDDGIPEFTEYTEQAGLRTREAYFGLGVRFFDADGDGYPSNKEEFG